MGTPLKSKTNVLRFILAIPLLVSYPLISAEVPDNLPGPKKPTPLDQFILAGMKEAKVPGLAALTIKEGKIFWAGYYGWANIKDKQPVTKDTLFQLASISKTVTACMIMQQVEKGKLKLDADINTLLPFKVRNPKHAHKPITLRQLLTHTSGIRDNWNVLEDTWVKNGDSPKPLGKSLLAYLREDGEFFSAKKSFYSWAPGTKNQYSNVGFTLAAYVAEAQLKASFEALCEKGIFKTLGMDLSFGRSKPQTGGHALRLPQENGRLQGAGTSRLLGLSGWNTSDNRTALSTVSPDVYGGRKTGRDPRSGGEDGGGHEKNSVPKDR